MNVTRHRIGVSALLVLLVLLAGCTALPFVSDGGSSGSPYAPPGEPLDGSELQSQHLDRLGSAETVTVNSSDVLVINGSVAERHRNVTALNLTSGEALRHRYGPAWGDDALDERHLYFNGSVAFVNETRGSGPDQYTHYFQIGSPAEEPGFAPLSLSTYYEGLGAKVDAFNWTHGGVTKHDATGATVTRYTATLEDVKNRAQFAESFDHPSPSQIDQFEATLLVQENGLVRELSYEVDETWESHSGDPVPVTRRSVLRITSIDGDTIERPEWTGRT